MKDFDELLNEVLREDAAAESRAGLELRVMARVRGKRRGGFGFGLGSRGWGWLFPAVVCAGIVAAMWFVPRTEMMVAPVSSGSSASSVASASSPEIAGLRVERRDSLVEGEGRLSSVGSGRALRDAHLSRDRAAAKMGHPAELPKRKVFPSPAPVDAFPAPAGVEDAQTAARELSSAKAVEALLDLRREQAEPVRVAAIQIAPLVMDEDGRRVQ